MSVLFSVYLISSHLNKCFLSNLLKFNSVLTFCDSLIFVILLSIFIVLIITPIWRKYRRKVLVKELKHEMFFTISARITLATTN